MAKKKKVEPVVEAPAAPKPRQSNFRPWDAGLFEALDHLSTQPGEYFRRSRNDIMNILLQDRLKELGLWPWPPAGG